MIHLLAQSDPLATTIMISGIALIAGVLLLNLRKRNRARGENADDGPRDRLDRMEQVGRTRNDLRAMMVELEELTRRFSAQLDNKSRRLDQLLDEADEKIAELRRLQGLPPNQPTDRANGSASSDPDAPRTTDPDPFADPTLRTADADPPDTPGSSNGADPFARKVYALADAGKDAHQIARELDEHVGKIELILALRQPT